MRRDVIGKQNGRWKAAPLVTLVVSEVAPTLEKLQRDHCPRLAIGRALIWDWRCISALENRNAGAIIVKRTFFKERSEVLVRRRLLIEPPGEPIWVRVR